MGAASGIDVSVIITCYNVESYITRAIDSALHQQGVTLEVIVVDDASTDNSWSIISQIADPRVKSIRLPANAGPAAARNAGFNIAQGEWIAVLDGDDAFAPNRLATCLSHSKADVIVDNLLVCRESDGAEFLMFPTEAFNALSPLSAADFIRGKISCKNNYTLGYLKPIFLRRFLNHNQLSYDTDLLIGEDYQLLLECLLKGASCIIEPTAGYRYTARSSSISYRLSQNNIHRMLEADHRLLGRYSMDTAAAKAQASRTHDLKQELAYTQIIDFLKQKDWYSALKTVVSHPVTLWLLRRPLEVRIKRLFRTS